MFETLKIERKDGYAVVTLNRPGALNALSSKLIREFAAAFAEFETDPDVELVILTGAGRAFCAGLDTKELGTAGVHAFDIEKFNIPDIIERFPGPVIAAINGLAVTGGFEIALACDAILVAESARFIDSHSWIGLLPGWGLSQRLSRAIGPYRAKDLSLSGRALSGSEAAHGGLRAAVFQTANCLTPPENLPARWSRRNPECWSRSRSSSMKAIGCHSVMRWPWKMQWRGPPTRFAVQISSASKRDTKPPGS